MRVVQDRGLELWFGCLCHGSHASCEGTEGSEHGWGALDGVHRVRDVVSENKREEEMRFTSYAGGQGGL